MGKKGKVMQASTYIHTTNDYIPKQCDLTINQLNIDMKLVNRQNHTVTFIAFRTICPLSVTHKFAVRI